MNNRRSIQQAHERAQVVAFLDWFNHQRRSDFAVVEEPNPPEAVVRSKRTTRWLEVTDAFWNEEHALDEYSYATPGERHRPMSSGGYADMTNVFCKNFVSVLKKKLEKPSYLPWAQKHGPGYLVIAVYFPFFSSPATLVEMRQAWSAAKTSVNDLGCFRGVYLSLASCGLPVPFSRWAI